jgi:hypothetical protein
MEAEVVDSIGALGINMLMNGGGGAKNAFIKVISSLVVLITKNELVSGRVGGFCIHSVFLEINITPISNEIQNSIDRICMCYYCVIYFGSGEFSQDLLLEGFYNIW